MNIVLCADNNYAPYLGVVIYSILSENSISGKNKVTEESIHFYILDSEISEINVHLINEMVRDFSAQITFLNTKNIHNDLLKKIKSPVRSLSTYYRLYLPSILSDSINKLIYMDCDGYVRGSLKELWETDIESYDIAGVKDVISIENKKRVGLKSSDDYFNAGMLLINLKQWRKNGIQQQTLDFVNKHNGKVAYHDQGTINGVCLKKKVLHPKWNVMTPILIMSENQILDYHKIEDFYPEDVLQEARDDPKFIHLVPSLSDRPWIAGNYHPKKEEYLDLMDSTPWKGTRVHSPSKVLEPWVKIMFHYLRYPLFISVLRGAQSFKPKTWLLKLLH
ncbi:glycosyltransferase family 8 protein [Bacteroidia bacterium]|nr:glycosyltransferase family 8 protein [Bacteroidia bacterium]